jgi:choline dehydrogenase
MARWAELVDDPRYLFENVLPFYKKTIAFTPPDGHRFENSTVPYSRSSYDRTGLPVEVTYPRYAMPFSTWASGGFQAIGINETVDFNGGQLMGHQFCAMTIRASDQTRSSSETGFLRGSLGYTTLSVYQTTLAKRILFDAQKRATGVEVERQGRFTLTASKEVIVSAGAFQSPQLLMVSGIGPAATLQAHGVNVIADLPGVGQNMWDHTFFGPSYRVAVDTFTKLSLSPWYSSYQITAWATTKNGVLTNPSADYISFEKLPPSSRSGFSAANEKDLAWFPADWPEIEVCQRIPIPLTNALN